MAKAWLFFFLLTSASTAFGLDAELKCAAETAYASNRKDLSRVGRWVSQYLREEDFKSSTPDEVRFVQNNPESALALVNSGCAAMRVSYGYCEVDVFQEGLLQPGQAEPITRAAGEEADAVRHFTFSALLACAKGKTFAERYTIAREGPPPWDESSEMDIHNNYQGFAWADPKFGRCLLPDLEKRILLAALRSLRDHKLVILKRGDTACGDPKALIRKVEKMSEDETRALFMAQSRKLRQRFPNYCR